MFYCIFFILLLLENEAIVLKISIFHVIKLGIIMHDLGGLDQETTLTINMVEPA